MSNGLLGSSSGDPNRSRYQNPPWYAANLCFNQLGLQYIAKYVIVDHETAKPFIPYRYIHCGNNSRITLLTRVSPAVKNSLLSCVPESLVRNWNRYAQESKQ